MALLEFADHLLKPDEPSQLHLRFTTVPGHVERPHLLVH